jgi:hypothetical protein
MWFDLCRKVKHSLIIVVVVVIVVQAVETIRAVQEEMTKKKKKMMMRSVVSAMSPPKMKCARSADIAFVGRVWLTSWPPSRHHHPPQSRLQRAAKLKVTAIRKLEKSCPMGYVALTARSLLQLTCCSSRWPMPYYIHTYIHTYILPVIYICYLIASKQFNLSNHNWTSTLWILTH